MSRWRKHKEIPVVMRIIDGCRERVITDAEEARGLRREVIERIPQSWEYMISKDRDGIRIAASSEVFGDDPGISELAFDPTAELPSQEDFVQEEERFKPDYVFKLSDLPEGQRNYAALVEFATSKVDIRRVGVLGPNLLYHGRAMPALEVQLREMGMPLDEIRYMLDRVAGRVGDRVYHSWPGMTPEIAARFAMGGGAHEQEEITRQHIAALERLLDAYEEEGLEPRRNRPPEPAARKYDALRR